MTEEKKEKSNTGNVIGIASILSVAGMLFTMYTGVLDRGASSGSFNEKVVTLDRSLAKLEDRVTGVNLETKQAATEGQKNGLEIAIMQEKLNSMKIDIARLENSIREIREQTVKGFK